MITAITLENFKGIREPVRIELAPLTLLFGPNNAGKSTIIQALIYAREIFERGDTDPRRTLMGGDTLDLGGFDSLVHGRDRSRPIRMRFELGELDSTQWQHLHDSLGEIYGEFEEFLPSEDPDVAYHYSLPPNWRGYWLSGSDGRRFWETEEFPELHGQHYEDPLDYSSFDTQIGWQPPNFLDLVLSAGRLWLELVISFNMALNRPVVTDFRVGSVDNPDLRIDFCFDPKNGTQYLSHLSLGSIPFGTATTPEQIPDAICNALSKRCGASPATFHEDVTLQPIQPDGRCAILLSTRATLTLLGYPDGQLGQAVAARTGVDGAIPNPRTSLISIQPAGPQRSPEHDAMRLRADGEQYEPNWAETTGSWLLTPIVQTLLQAARDCFSETIMSSTYLSSHRTMPERLVGLPWRAPTKAAGGYSQLKGSDWAWQTLMRDDGNLIRQVNEWLTGKSRFNAGVKLASRTIVIGDNDGDFATLLKDLRKGVAETSPDASRAELFGRLLASWENFQRETEIWFARLGSQVKVPLQDMGAGMAHLIPVLVAALRGQSGDGIVAIEEPESKVHPAFQVVLADLFLTQAKANPGGMLLVETHSEHLMLRCLRRIRETAEGNLPEGIPPVTPEDLAVHFVEPDEDGQPRIHRIRLDETGAFLDPWPRGFFPERAREVYGDDL